MEGEFEAKMSGLREQFEAEKKRKADLDKELVDAKAELENIELNFPNEQRELKD